MQKLAALIFAISLFVTPAFAGKYNAVLEIGDPMPTFSKLPATSGEQVSSAQLDGDAVVLISLANHCPWVRGGDQDLVEFVAGLEDMNVDVVGFSVNHMEEDRLPAMKKHAAENDYNFTYVFDESQEIGRKLGATRTPEFFVFDKDRKLVYMGLLHNSPAKATWTGGIKYTNGEPTEFYVRDAVVATLAGKPVEKPETKAHGCSIKYEEK